MSFLLDVNFLLACAWASHAEHPAARAWLEQQASFVTCPFAELGFVRVSLSPGFRSSLPTAQEALADLTSRQGARFIAADLPVSEVAGFATHGEATDAYLVALARRHGLRLATLDDALCGKSWAQGIAVNPLKQAS